MMFTRLKNFAQVLVKHIKFKILSKQFYVYVLAKMIIFVFVLSLIFGVIGVNILTKDNMTDAKEKSMSTLAHRASILEEMLYSIETQAFYFINNSRLDDYVKSNFFYQDVTLSLDIVYEVSVLKNNNEYLNEICIYSKNMDGVYSTRLGFLSDKENILFKDINKIELLSNACGWIHSEQNSQVVYYCKIPLTGNKTYDGIIAFYISEEQLLNRTLAIYGEFFDTVYYVLDESNDILMSYYSPANSNSISKKQIDSYVVNNLLKEKESNYFETEIDDVKMMVSVVKETFSDRTYVLLMKKKLLLENIYRSAGTFVVVLLMSVVVGAILSVFWSRNIYSPIKNLVMQCSSIDLQEHYENNELSYIHKCFDTLRDEIRCLNENIFELRNKLRDDLLLTLLKEPHPWSSDFFKKCESYSLDTSYQYIVLAVFPISEYKIENLKELIINLTSSINKTDEQFNAVALDNHIAIVISFSPTVCSHDITNIIKNISEELIRLCESEGAEVYIGIGILCDQLNNLYYSYQSAFLNATNFTYESSNRIFYGCELENECNTVKLVYECSQRIKSSLEKDNTSMAIDELDKFINFLSSKVSVYYALPTIKLLLSNLIFVAYNNMQHLSDNALEKKYFYMLENCKTITETRNLFVSVIVPLLKNNEISKRNNSVIPGVCDYIQKNVYRDITLTDCADYVGVSPNYLSKIFRKEMKMSFLDYVINCKVREVQRLLISTNLSVETIAEKIGYSTRNLYRVFYKVTGMTPNEFRQAQSEII